MPHEFSAERLGKRFAIGAISLQPGDGGISRVARCSVASLQGHVELCRTLKIICRKPPSDLPLLPNTTTLTRKHYAGFIAEIQLASCYTDVYLYDFIGTARAHRLGPARRKPYACWCHGIEVWERARPAKLRSLRSSSLAIFNSHYTLTRHQKLHGMHARAKVCWLGTEQDDFPCEDRNMHRPTVVIIGRLQPDRPKGHDQLLRVWDRVVDAVPDAMLEIVGKGPDMERIAHVVDAIKSRESVVLHGFVPDGVEMESLWKRASLFVMPSYGEGFGLVYVEAMRWAVPVIASTADAGDEINKHGVSGFNVDVDDDEALCDYIVSILRDSRLRNQLSKGAQARWAEHFRASVFQRRFTKCLTSYF